MQKARSQQQSECRNQQVLEEGPELQYSGCMGEVGAELRQLRTSKSLTLEQVAERSGLSTSFLSQVERGICSPSIVSLEKICEALEIPAGELLRGDSGLPLDEQNGSPVVRRDEGLKLQIGAYPVWYEYIGGTCPDREIEVIVHKIPAGHRSDLVGHDGEEFGYVLEGQFLLQTESGEYILEEGDSYHFMASRAHGYGALEKSPAVVLVVSTQKFVDWYETALGSGKGLRTAAQQHQGEAE